MPTMTIRLGMGVFGFWLAVAVVCAALVLRPAIAPVATPAGADATPASGPAEPAKPDSAKPDLAKPTGDVAKQTRAFLAAVARAYDRVADEVEHDGLSRKAAPDRFRELARPAEQALQKAIDAVKDEDYPAALREEAGEFRRLAR
jgi:hypothetical protein